MSGDFELNEIFGGPGFKISSFDIFDVYLTPEKKTEVGVLKFVNKIKNNEFFLYRVRYPKFSFYKGNKPTDEVDKSIVKWTECYFSVIESCIGDFLDLKTPKFFYSNKVL